MVVGWRLLFVEKQQTNNNQKSKINKQ